MSSHLVLPLHLQSIWMNISTIKQKMPKRSAVFSRVKFEKGEGEIRQALKLTSAPYSS